MRDYPQIKRIEKNEKTLTWMANLVRPPAVMMPSAIILTPSRSTASRLALVLKKR